MDRLQNKIFLYHCLLFIHFGEHASYQFHKSQEEAKEETFNQTHLCGSQKAANVFTWWEEQVRIFAVNLIKEHKCRVFGLTWRQEQLIVCNISFHYRTSVSRKTVSVVVSVQQQSVVYHWLEDTFHFQSFWLKEYWFHHRN